MLHLLSSIFFLLPSPHRLSKSMTESIRQRAMAKISSRNFSPFCGLLGISVADLQQLPGMDLLDKIVT